jgi:hypothetical protein
MRKVSPTTDQRPMAGITDIGKDCVGCNIVSSLLNEVTDLRRQHNEAQCTVRTLGRGIDFYEAKLVALELELKHLKEGGK